MIFAEVHRVKVRKVTFLLLMLLIGGGNLLVAQKMDNRGLKRILQSVTDSLEGVDGLWQVRYSDRLMFVITDEGHDRMRIISPVMASDEITNREMEEALMANFHSALDARYAISEGIVWAAFIHPLRSLSEEQVRDGLLQVFRAAETFGTTYSSSELVFPGREGSSGQSGKSDKKM